MKYIKENVTKDDLTKINNTLIRFDKFIQGETRTPTDEYIGIYEHWIDCMYDIQKVIIKEE